MKRKMEMNMSMKKMRVIHIFLRNQKKCRRKRKLNSLFRVKVKDLLRFLLLIMKMTISNSNF